MNEPENQTTEQSPEEYLSQGLQGLLSGNSSEESSNGGESAKDSQSQAETRTPDAEKDTNGSKAEKSEDKPKSDSTPISNSEGQKPNRKPSRSEERIRELAEQNKKLVQERDEAMKKINASPLAKSQEKSKEPKIIVPKPKEPQFTKEHLQQVRAQAIQANDANLLEAVKDEESKWRQYDVDLKLWNFENGQAVAQQEGLKANYTKRAVEKWPALADSTSKHYQTFNKFAKAVPEIADRPDGNYILAEVADLVLRDVNRESEMGALKEQLKKSNEELDRLKGKLKPATQSSTTETGGINDADDPGERLSQRLRELLPA